MSPSVDSEHHSATNDSVHLPGEARIAEVGGSTRDLVAQQEDSGELSGETLAELPAQKIANNAPAAVSNLVSAPGVNGRGKEVASERSALNSPATHTEPLHRIAQARASQGLTDRTIAKRMGIDLRSYRALECPQADLKLSELAAVQKALEVPVLDLLEDQQALSRPVEERAKLVRIMKTAVALTEASPSPRIQRLSQMLCEQLKDLMPELEEVGGWPQFGARRGTTAVGRALAQPIDTSELGDL